MANDNLNNQQMPQGTGLGARGAQGAQDAKRIPRSQDHVAPMRSAITPDGRSARQQPATVTIPPQGQGDPRTASVSPATAAARPTQKRTILIIIGVVVAALAIWLLIFLFACNGDSLLDPTAQNGQAPYKSAEEMQAELDRVVEEGMFNISIASVIQFENGTSPGTAYIENVPGNHYLMQVAITEDDTGDVLYESGILKPDQFIENIALTKELDAGTYDATATFTALDETTYEEVGQAAAKVTLNVLN